MKLCHAAALALTLASLCLSCAGKESTPKSMGRYLMIPPDIPKPFDSSRWRSNVPIAHWTIVGSFHSSDVCKEALENSIAEAYGKAQESGDPSVRMTETLRFVAIKNNAVCVATDDPRLNETKLLLF